MAALQSNDSLDEMDGPLMPCVRCQVPTDKIVFASANVYTGVDEDGQKVAQWLKPIPVCERHRRDLLGNMGVLSWCTRDQAWGLAGQPCICCGKVLTVRYRRS